MMNRFSTPPVVANLLIINALLLMTTMLLNSGIGGVILNYGALYPVQSPYFKVYQLVTYMFLHANFSHLFFNMFALWMFGRTLENSWGSRKFLIYYMVCGIGAGVIQLLVNYFSGVPAATIGASGAVFGLLLGFGMMYPNSVIMLLIPPIPIKAKYFVIIFGVIELFAGIHGSLDNIAHFAHVGGMLWGFLLLIYWKRKGQIFY